MSVSLCLRQVQHKWNSAGKSSLSLSLCNSNTMIFYYCMTVCVCVNNRVDERRGVLRVLVYVINAPLTVDETIDKFMCVFWPIFFMTGQQDARWMRRETTAVVNVGGGDDDEDDGCCCLDESDSEAGECSSELSDDEEELGDDDDDEEELDDDQVMNAMGAVIERRRSRAAQCWTLIKKYYGIFQQSVKALVEHKYFQQGLLGAILVNTLSMGIEYHNQVFILLFLN